VSFAGMNHMELIKRKEASGRRTLDTGFVDLAIGKPKPAAPAKEVANAYQD